MLVISPVILGFGAAMILVTDSTPFGIFNLSVFFVSLPFWLAVVTSSVCFCCVNASGFFCEWNMRFEDNWSVSYICMAQTDKWKWERKRGKTLLTDSSGSPIFKATASCGITMSKEQNSSISSRSSVLRGVLGIDLSRWQVGRKIIVDKEVEKTSGNWKLKIMNYLTNSKWGLPFGHPHAFIM